MRIAVADYDLRAPNAIGRLEGYDAVEILVRLDRVPLGVLTLPKGADEPCLGRDAIELAVLRQFGPGPILTLARREPAAAGRPAITVAVCTRDRPQALKRCLAALGGLRYGGAFEVIVVDNASRGGQTAAVVAAVPGVRYVREDEAGLDWARNRAVAQARHRIIAFVDDDVAVHPDWLEGVADGFARQDAAAVTGLVLPAELETPAQRLFEIYGGMGKGLRGRVFRREHLTPAGLMRSQAFGVGANMAFDRQALLAIGGFDTALDVGTPSGGGGDLDIFYRLLMAGHAIRYEPLAIVRHQHRRDLDGLRRQLYNNGRSYGVLIGKRWRERELGRLSVLRFALSWSAWLLARPALRLAGRHRLPMSLMTAELRGALSAPFAFIATHRQDARVRSRRNLRAALRPDRGGVAA